jgi:hypothetical protein
MYSMGDQVSVCPLCGSRNVRWRNRRFYDVIFTWLRYGVENTLATVLTRGATTATGPAAGREPYVSDVLRSRIEVEEYGPARRMYEEKIGLTTARRFWRCPDCRQKGQVFAGIDDTLTGGRATLASMEDEITGGLGSASTPVDRDGLSND